MSIVTVVLAFLLACAGALGFYNFTHTYPVSRTDLNLIPGNQLCTTPNVDLSQLYRGNMEIKKGFPIVHTKTIVEYCYYPIEHSVASIVIDVVTGAIAGILASVGILQTYRLSLIHISE